MKILELKEEAAVLSEFERARCRTIPDDKVPSVSRLRFKAVRDGPPRPNRQAELLKGAIKRKRLYKSVWLGSCFGNILIMLQI